ncbi:MAG: alpha/beta hydrolase [Acetobacteraceae bacterium]
MLVLLHGALRSGQVFLEGLAPYRAWADVLVPDLPGSGRSESPLAAGIEALADDIVSLVRGRLPGRRPTLVGESAGGLVALACCDGRLPGASLVLLDPPLSMAKQWAVQRNIGPHARQSRDWFPTAQAQAVFGLDAQTGMLEERLYYPLFRALAAPCLILHGDTPLFPVRTADRVPNCFDEVDATIVRLLRPDCRIERLDACGHLVFQEGGLRCHDRIRAFARDTTHG